MSKLILPDSAKPKKLTPDENFNQMIFTQAFGKYKDDFADRPDKRRHAVTHWIAATHGWGVIETDWCPTCNGQLQRDFEEFFAELQKQNEEARQAEVEKNLQPTLDEAEAQGKLIRFPTVESADHDRPGPD